MKEWRLLCDRISSLKRVAISFSGGVDSTVVLAAAVNALPEDHIAVFADIPMISERQRRIARDVAEELGANLISAELSWDDMPRVRDNGADRCYHCKRAIYSSVRKAASLHEYDVCADGENASDPASERPGRKAAAELGIVSPLKDLGIERSTVRKMFDDLGLKTRVHKETCMATRLPAGVPFTGKDIIFIEECENVIRNASGVEQIRMRLRDGYAELFASPDEIMLLIRNEKEISSMLAVKGVPKIRINMNGYEE